MSWKKVGLAVAGTAAAGAVILGGAGLADAADKATPPGGHGYGHGHRDRGGHTPVAGDELAKVSAAVKAKDPAATVAGVHKDPDGSYDVFATKNGNRVRYEVSADLKTVTERERGPRGAGHGPRRGTEVTGDELAKVSAAVKAKDSAATVAGVRKDPDGTYHVFATKNDNRVMYEVSADLKTVTERQAGPRGPHGHRGGPR